MRTHRRDPPALVPFLLPVILFGVYLVLTSKKIVEPVKRGFFRDDESIGYPGGDDTVEYNTVLWIALTVTPIFIIIGSITDSKKRICMEVFIYFFGFLMATFVTEVVKRYAGRLRPDFLARCQPDYSEIDDSVSFIVEDICTGKTHNVIEGRKSLPSGHSMTSAYGAVYLMTVWTRVRKRNGIHSGVSTFVMVVLFLYPLVVAATRVANYKHHPLDVFFGNLLGYIFALYTALHLNGWVGQEATYFGVTLGGTCALLSSADREESELETSLSLQKEHRDEDLSVSTLEQGNIEGENPVCGTF